VSETPTGKRVARALRRGSVAIARGAHAVAHRPSRKSIHELRVALRQLRSIAATLRQGGARGKGSLRRLEKAAKRLFSSLAAAREAQVAQRFGKRLLGRDVLASRPGVLREALADAKRAARDFDGAAFEESVARATAKLEAGISRALDRGLERREGRVVERLAEATAASGEPDATQRLHRLRVAIKRLRYPLEVAARRKDAALREALAAVQRELGVRNDLAALETRIAERGDAKESKREALARQRDSKKIAVARRRTMSGLERLLAPLAAELARRDQARKRGA
jgi:CHAD domain-containing protein